MAERLSYSEIVKRFPNEHILLANPETDEQQRVIEGELLYHSENQQDVYAKALELRPKHSAFLFTGKLSKDVIVII